MWRAAGGRAGQASRPQVSARYPAALLDSTRPWPAGGGAAAARPARIVRAHLGILFLAARLPQDIPHDGERQQKCQTQCPRHGFGSADQRGWAAWLVVHAAADGQTCGNVGSAQIRVRGASAYLALKPAIHSSLPGGSRTRYRGYRSPTSHSVLLPDVQLVATAQLNSACKGNRVESRSVHTA